MSSCRYNHLIYPSFFSKETAIKTLQELCKLINTAKSSVSRPHEFNINNSRAKLTGVLGTRSNLGWGNSSTKNLLGTGLAAAATVLFVYTAGKVGYFNTNNKLQTDNEINLDTTVVQRFTVRVVAKESEVAALNKFIHAVAEDSCRGGYTDKQIALLNRNVFGIHDGDGAITDGTCFVVENGVKIIAVGGWSKRSIKDKSLLTLKDPARIRTFFVDPQYQKYGLGSLLLHVCENAAIEAGFQSAILYATLNAEKFYNKNGYIPTLLQNAKSSF